MTRPRVKICGITRAIDAQLAVELGADAIGFVFWEPSPRAISPAAAAEIAIQLPRDVTRVGVFVDAAPGIVSEIAEQVGLDAAQLHGDEDVAAYADCRVALLKAIALNSQESLASAVALPPDVTLLIDAHAPIDRGGTGQLADWTEAARLAASRPVVLAGGLHAGNIVQAIGRVRPWGVDVSSGVEDAPGLKNAGKMRALFTAIGGNRVDAKGLMP